MQYFFSMNTMLNSELDFGEFLFSEVDELQRERLLLKKNFVSSQNVFVSKTLSKCNMQTTNQLSNVM